MLLLIHCLLFVPIVCGGSVFGPLFCYVLLSGLSSFAIILMGKRELVTLLCLPDVFCPLVFSGSSSQCRGFVSSVRLQYFLIISIYFFAIILLKKR